MKTIQTVYRYPLRISPTAASTFYQWSCACRYLWNRILRLRTGIYKRYKKNMGYTGPSGTNRRLTTLRGRYEWLRDCPNSPQQEILRDMDKAFKNFYRRVKQGQTPGYPRFKRKGILPRLYFPKQRFKIEIDEENRHYLNLTKMKQSIRIDVDRPYLEHPDDAIVSCSIIKDGKYWFLCLLVSKQIPEIIKRDLPPVGINRGIVRTVALSNGGGYQIDVDRIKYLEGRKEHLQRRLSKRVGSKKGQKKSGRWLRMKRQIDRIDHDITGIRRNFNHQTSRDIVNNYDNIAVEDYDIKQMTRSAKGNVDQPGKKVQVKANFNRMQLRNAWGSLVAMLEYKSAWLGGLVTKIDPHHITQKCCACDYIHENNVNKRTRRFCCGRCGYETDMDTNAAENVLQQSIQAPVGLPG